MNVVEARRVLEHAIRESGVDAHGELEYLLTVIQSGVAAYDELQRLTSAVERVRQLCRERMLDDDTAVDTVWPQEVLAALDPIAGSSR